MSVSEAGRVQQPKRRMGKDELRQSTVSSRRRERRRTYRLRPESYRGKEKRKIISAFVTRAVIRQSAVGGGSRVAVLGPSKMDRGRDGQRMSAPVTDVLFCSAGITCACGARRLRPARRRLLDGFLGENHVGKY